jgi:hypothetical protein
MRRREFITLLGSAGVAWPLAAHAQQQPMPVIGFLNPTSPDASADRLCGFRQGLKDSGYIDGENAAIIYSWAEDQFDRVPALASELVRRPVAVIVAIGNAAAMAATAATTAMPVVFLAKPPRKISKQLLMILPKIREMDACLRSEPAAAPRVFERYSQLSYRSQSLTSKCLSAWPLWDQSALRPWTTCAW